MRMATSDSIRLEANELFSSGKFTKSCDLYSQAIDLDKENAILYANRSFCYLKLEKYQQAVDDANLAIQLDSNYLKAYYRRGAANMAMLRFREAASDFKHIIKIKSNDKNAQNSYKYCQNKINQSLFAEAISYEEKLLIDSINLQSLSLDNKYEGPHLFFDDNQCTYKMTHEFVDQLIRFYKERRILCSKYLLTILKLAKDYLINLPSLIHVDTPINGKITVCGDVHGQFFDLINIFELNGYPSDQHYYLFNGDFVDRGAFSIEVMVILFCYMLLYPGKFLLNRGNHETISMNQIFGFQQQVQNKYSLYVFNLFSEVFKHLPLATVINKRIFVVHGGLPSKDGVTFNDILQINRFTEVIDGSVMCDLLWADPHNGEGWAPSHRGTSKLFGPDVTRRFCSLNNIDFVIRSHEMVEEGYRIDHNGNDINTNKGAFIHIDSTCIPKYIQFNAVPHPKEFNGMSMF